MARVDPHSVTDDAQPATKHLEWDARVDFEDRRLHCTVALHFHAPATAATPLDLDARGLDIESVSALDDTELRFESLPTDAVFGTPLRIQVPAGATGVMITYRTSNEASALQWLAPAQTHGGQKPYLFSQCQAIHARSLIPCQDTPARRVTCRPN